MLDEKRLRAEFPLLARRVDGRSLIYLDSAATSLKPRAVLDAERRFYEEVGANVHRGRHFLSEEASFQFARARSVVADFINAPPEETIFVAGATMAINLVSLGLGLCAGDNVVATMQEHHANLLPWYGRCEVRLAPVDGQGLVDAGALAGMLDASTRLVAIGHASNATGAIQDLRPIIEAAHRRNIPVLVDACQSAAHLKIDVQELDVDFLVFSGHKMLGPMGTGVLYGKRARLEGLGAPIRGGGAVSLVTMDSFTLKALPERLEPGTPNVAGAIGLAAAVSFLEGLGRDDVIAHERRLVERMLARAANLPDSLELLGPRDERQRLPLLSFVVRGSVSPDHVALRLSEAHHVLVRSGHHCCHPFFDSLGAAGSVRFSAHVYNTLEEIDIAMDALESCIRGFVV